MMFRSAFGCTSEARDEQRELCLVTRAALPERHGCDELGVIGVSEFLVPTHQIVGDLVWRVGTEVEAIHEMPRGGKIHGFLGDVLHATPLLQTRRETCAGQLIVFGVVGSGVFGRAVGTGNGFCGRCIPSGVGGSRTLSATVGTLLYLQPFMAGLLRGALTTLRSLAGNSQRNRRP